MSVSSPAAPLTAADEPSRHPWREAVLWLVFASVLVVGLGLAVVFGPAAPVLLDTVLLDTVTQ